MHTSTADIDSAGDRISALVGKSALHSIEVASRSDIGRRRAINQDRCAYLKGANGLHLFVVADGMGGHHAGEVAAQLVVDTCGEALSHEAGSLETLARGMLAAANSRIREHGAANMQLSGMGSTGTLLLMAPERGGCIAHVGDSRAYRIRGSTIEALTEDHSLTASLVRAYQLDPAIAREHPRRNELLRSLGTAADLDIDVRTFPVKAGDHFVLCSDGVWNLVSDSEIFHRVSSLPPETAAQAIVDLANARGGPDNITIQVVVPHMTPRAVLLPVRACAPSRVLVGILILAPLALVALYWLL